MKYLLLIASSVILLSGCYREEISALENQLESFKQTSIEPLSKQIENMQNSISTLEAAQTELSKTVAGLNQAQTDLQTKLDAANEKLKKLEESQTEGIAELKEQLTSLKTELEEKLKVVNASIDALNANYAALDKRISDLKSESEKDFADVWSEFEKTANIISGIETDIETLTQAIDNVNTSLSGRIDELQSSFSKEIQDKADEITRAYKDAISQAKTDILFEVDEHINAAIEASKDKILGWVNKELQEKYYTAAKIDELIKILENADSEINEEIKQLKNDLDDATKTLQKAIEDAIKNAKIDEKIAAAIDALAPDIERIKNTLSQCMDDLTSLATRVTSLELQAQKMEQAITDLQGADVVLQGYINALKETADQLRQDLNKANGEIDILEDSLKFHRQAISAIQSNLVLIESRIKVLEEAHKQVNERISDLAKQINEIRTSIDSKIDTAKDWANKTFVTLEEYGKTVTLVNEIVKNVEDLQKSIPQLKQELLDKIGEVDKKLIKALEEAETRITKAYTKDIEDAVKKLDEDIKNWVSSKLEKEYKKASDIEAELAALEKAYKEADAVHTAQIEKLQEDLEALQGQIESTCKNCIAEAVLDDGVIGKAIISAINELDSKIQEKFTQMNKTISDLEERLTSAESKIGTCEDQLKNMNTLLEQLKSADEQLKEWIEKIQAVIGKVPDDYKSTIMADLKALQEKDKELARMITDLNNSILTGEISTTIKGWIDTSLKNYYNKTEIDDKLSEINKTIATATGDIEKLAGRVDALETLTGEGGELRVAIAAVREYCETLLNDYYTTTEIDGKISEYKDLFNNYYTKAQTYSKEEIDQILDGYYTKSGVGSYVAEKIKELGDVATETDLKTKYEAALKELKEGYAAAIAEAIEDSEGRITTAIQDEIDKVRGTYTGTMQDLKDQIDELLAKASKLENLVQSIVYIPEVEDGKVKMNYGYNQETSALEKGSSEIVRFKVNTNSTKFAEEYSKFNYKVLATITKTKAVGDIDTLEVSNKTYKDGILSIEISGEKLSNDFYVGNVGASISLYISDGYTNIASEYIPLVRHETTEKPELWLDKYSCKVESWKGGDTYSQEVNVNCSGAWSITEKPDWITVMPAAPYSGNIKLTLIASQYDMCSADRTGAIKFVSAGKGHEKTLQISQTKRPEQVITVTSSVSVPHNFISAQGIAVSSSDNITDWSVSPLGDNCSGFKVEKYVKQEFGTQSDFTGIVVTPLAANRTTTDKTLTLKVKPATAVSFDSQEVKICTFTQQARPAEQVLTVTSKDYTGEAGWKGVENTFNVSSSDLLSDWTASCTIDDVAKDILTIEKDDPENGTGTVKVTVPINMTASAKTIKISFVPAAASGGTTVVKTITQQARPAQVLTYNPSTEAITANWKGKISDADSYSIAITDDVNGYDDWTFVKQDGANWLTVNATQSSGKKTGLTLSVAKMTNSDWGSNRSATITVTPACGGAAKTFTVTQSARPAQTFSISPASGSTILQKVNVSSSGYSSWKRYTYSFANLNFTSTPSDGETDWSVSTTTSTYSVSHTAGSTSFSVSKQTLSNQTEDFNPSPKTENLNVTLTSFDDTPTNVSYTVKQYKSTKDLGLITFDASNNEIKVSLPAGYKIFCDYSSSYRMNSGYNLKVNDNSIYADYYKDAKKKAVDCNGNLTIKITGSGNNRDNTHYLKVNFNVIYPNNDDDFEDSFEIRIDFQKNGSQVTGIRFE